MKKIIIKLYSFIQKITGFYNLGSGSLIRSPKKIWNKDCIKIGGNTFIAENNFLAITKTENKKPIFKIGSNCCIGSNFFVACIDEIILEDDILISDRVFISDHIHNYKQINKPIISQNLIPRGKVKIKKGAFIGINSVIMPGVTIGKNSVIGASSVVTKNIPDFCVATGNPAKIIRKYDFKKNKWINTK